MTTLEKIIAYENGELEDAEETIEFFQEIIDSGLVWQLQGHYGRVAKSLIDAGLCTLNENKSPDLVDRINLTR
tara:strand:- start:21 stop:239 length:219 start_codon:yes stop_codon:yes gene_type:complete